VSPYRKRQSPAEEYTAMFRFLDAYDNKVCPNDVGGLLGQLATLRGEMPIDRRDQRKWHEAVSLAVTAH